VTSAWVGAIRCWQPESWLLSENRALAEQQFCFALHIALEAARLPISSFSPPLSGHMTHTQAESFYNFAYVRRFLVLVRFKNRPQVLNLTDVTPCPRVFGFSILESIIKSGLRALFSVCWRASSLRWRWMILRENADRVGFEPWNNIPLFRKLRQPRDLCCTKTSFLSAKRFFLGLNFASWLMQL
jgi:hypothetical protein